MGIEPTRPAWKAGTLPLSYTRDAPLESLSDSEGIRRMILRERAFVVKAFCERTAMHFEIEKTLSLHLVGKRGERHNRSEVFNTSGDREFSLGR